MSEILSSSAQKVQETLNLLGFDLKVIELPGTTRSSMDAAQAIGCEVKQIAKSLVFTGKESLRPVLVIASGANRVNEKRIEEYINEPIQKADANFVRENTGFTIGGVPPVGHLKQLLTFIDEDLLKYEEIWAAAGNPNAVFKLTPQDLVKMTAGKVICIK